MIHPTHLLRTDSEVSRFVAPRSIDFNESDCGIKILPCIGKRLNLEKYYKITIFIAFLTTLAVLQSSSTAYFIGTTKVWRHNYNLSEKIAEWIVYLSPIFGGVFGVMLAYWGGIIHRASYIGGLAMLHAIAGWVLIVPEMYHPSFLYFNTSAVANPQLCRQTVSSPYNTEYDEGKKYIALGVIIMYQLIHSLSFVSLIAHGISYIDDGCKKFASTANICVVVAGWQIGKFIGQNTTLIPIAFNRHIFFSFAWLIMMTGIFIFGFLISLFPKYPKRIMVDYGVNVLLNRRRSTIAQDNNIGFCASMSSILTTKLLWINVTSAVFMNIAILNFAALREEFFRSRFINFSDEFDYHFTFYNASQMMFMCLIILVLGIIISKRKPSTKFFIIWIASVYLLVTLLFASYAFLKCEDQVELHYKQMQRFCNVQCQCDMDMFAPVCLEKKTYYSPCYAGCTGQKDNEYFNCACAASLSSSATDGSCNKDKCNMVSFIAESNGVITLGLKISAFIIHIIITLRAVQYQNLKATALGFLMSCYMIVPFIPFKIFYELVKESMCEVKQVECVQFKDSFPTAISIMTIGFMFLSIVFALCMLPFANNVNMYKRRNSYVRNTRLVDSNIPTLNEVNEDEEDDDHEMTPTGNNNDRTSDVSFHSVAAENVTTRLESEGYSDDDIEEELQRIEQNGTKKIPHKVEETSF